MLLYPWNSEVQLTHSKLQRIHQKVPSLFSCAIFRLLSCHLYTAEVANTVKYWEASPSFTRFPIFRQNWAIAHPRMKRPTKVQCRMRMTSHACCCATCSNHGYLLIIARMAHFFTFQISRKLLEPEISQGLWQRCTWWSTRFQLA